MPTENRSSNTAEPFKREDRYIVVKRSDLDKMHPSYKGNFLLELNCISAQMPSRKCLVIESDWPEYEPTWAAIERRVTGAPAPQPHPEPIAWMVGTAIWWTKEEAERDAEATGLPIVGLGPVFGIGPAEQHQGEPVAWVRFRNGEPDYDGDAVMIMNVPGDMIGDGDSWEPVYTHADPEEAERLRSMFDQTNADLREVTVERDNLRAEADRLRQEVASIDKKLRGNVSDPDPLKPIMPGALSITTTYGLVAGIVRERDQLKKALENKPS